jgi:hypothetical protein
LQENEQRGDLFTHQGSSVFSSYMEGAEIAPNTAQSACAIYYNHHYQLEGIPLFILQEAYTNKFHVLGSHTKWSVTFPFLYFCIH